VMAHESFEDPETASVMIEHFVNIKVDREERPDLDTIYMQAVVGLTGQGGWPMSVFLTPDTRPFYGGTYFPPDARYNLPSFRSLLQTIADLWAQDRQKLLANAETLTSHLHLSLGEQPAAAPLVPELLQEALDRMAETYRWKTGGWGDAPRFPHPMALEFSLLQAARGNEVARRMSLHALHAMARGGMYDLLGGGFARYSVDATWKVPHFEKMLYDNALLSRTYLHAFLLSGDEGLRSVCEETLDFVLREMSHPLGGFYSSLDADSEGIEGLFYTWEAQELRAVLSDPGEFDLFAEAYGITTAGDLHGRNCLQQTRAISELSVQFALPLQEVSAILERMRKKLVETRSRRIRPETDDKVLLFWNALMMTAFAEAGRFLQREDYLQAARRNASFLLTHMAAEDGLKRSWRNGTARQPAFLEDHAALILALLALYQSDPVPRWFTAALDLAHSLDNFRDAAGVFYDTQAGQDLLLLRPRDTQDNATPSGSALAAAALLQLSTYQGRSDWRQTAEHMIAAMVPEMLQFPTAFSQWLCAADFVTGPVQEVAIVGDPQHPVYHELTAALWHTYRPLVLAAFTADPDIPGQPALVQGRKPHGDQPAAYVCRSFRCLQPVHSMQDLEDQLNTPAENTTPEVSRAPDPDHST